MYSDGAVSRSGDEYRSDGSDSIYQQNRSKTFDIQISTAALMLDYNEIRKSSQNTIAVDRN